MTHDRRGNKLIGVNRGMDGGSFLQCALFASLLLFSPCAFLCFILSCLFCSARHA